MFGFYMKLEPQPQATRPLKFLFYLFIIIFFFTVLELLINTSKKGVEARDCKNNNTITGSTG